MKGKVRCKLCGDTSEGHPILLGMDSMNHLLEKHPKEYKKAMKHFKKYFELIGDEE